MVPEDNSLDNSPRSASVEPVTRGSVSYVAEAIDSASAKQEPISKLKLIPLLRYNRTAVTATSVIFLVIFLIGLVVLFFTGQSKSPDSQTSRANNYAVGTLAEKNLPSNNMALRLGNVSELQINGQLQVTKNIVITPSAVPSNPVAGEIYYNQANDSPYYYNGSTFVSLSPTPTPQHVSAIGGISGNIAVGNGLQVTNGQLSLSSQIAQSISAANTGPSVTSLQGRSGSITLTAGPGIAINGTTISLSTSASGVASVNNISGALALNGSSNEITVNNNNIDGSITLSTPQAIAVISSPTFEGLTISGLNSAGVVHTDGLGQLTTGPVALGTDTSGSYINSIGVTTGLTASGNSGANSTPSLIVDYGSGVDTSVEGNTVLTCPSGTGNLSGGGNAITLGAGGSCDNLSITSSPTFSSLDVNGVSGVTIGSASNQGILNLTDGTNDGFVASLDLNGNALGSNQTYVLPSMGGTICLSTGNCGGSGGVVSLNTISGSVALEDTNSQLTFTVAGQNLNIHLPQNLSSTSTPSFAGLTLTSALTVGNGGTGSTTAAGARTNLGAAASGANSDITSLTGLTTALPISEGGTGQATAPTAGEVLIGTTAGGLTPAALTQGTSVSITSGSGSITIGLGTSGVTANSYGSASSVATFTVNAEGQLTAAGSTPIAINGNQITSGNVGVAYGGTGITSYTTGSLLYASGSTTLSQLNDVATGQCLISGGVSTAPSWGACSTGGGITGSGTSGDLPLFNGSNSLTNSALSQASGNLTDSGSLTIQGAGGLLLSNGTSTDSILPGSNLSALSLTLPSAAGTSGQCLSTNGAAGVLSFSDCLTGATGGSGGVVSLNTISGSVALEDTNSQLTFTVAGQNLNIHLPQNLSSTSTPSFAGLTLTSALTVGNGGTGSTTAAGARTNLGAAASGANSDITSLTGLTTALPISEGGTGQATAPTAGEVLIGTTAGGLTPAALTQGTSVSITSGSGSITIGLGTSGVTANSYGSASSVATFTVNAEGQLTAAGSTPIAINGNQITSGNVGVAYGGTGITSYTTGSLLYASGSTTLSQLNDVATGQCLISGGVSTAPSWGACSTGGGITGSGTSGDLPLFNGSNSLTNSALSQASGNLTDSGSLTIQGAGGLLLSNGTSTDSILPGSNLSALSLTLPSAAGTSGQCLSTNGAAGVLSFSDCLTGATGGSGGVVSLNTISGSVALEDTNSQLTFTVAGQNLNIHLPQNLSSTSTPSFAGLTLTSALTVGNGGTGSTTAAGARTNLGAAASGANSDITSLTGLTTALPISEGGTGQATAPTAGEVLIGTTAGGLTPAALTQGTSVSITSGSGSITIGLGTSGVTANSYGSASSVATFTVNAEGQLTAAGSTPIAINGNQITSGNVGVAYGGTGITSYTTGSLLYASGSTTLSQLNDVATGQCLISGGVSTAPSWGSCASGGGITGTGASGALALFNSSSNLTSSALTQTSGNLTDSGSLTIQGAGGLTLDNGSATATIEANTSGTPTFVLPSNEGSSGQCLATDGYGNLSFATCLSGSGGSGGVVSLNTISGSVALEDTNSQLTFTVAGQNLNIHLPQNLSSTSTPSFAGLTLTSALTVGNGGTGSTTAAGARTNLGAAASGANSDITSLTGLTTALPISEGGTGQATAPTAGEVLIGTTAGGLTPAALTQGTSVSITSGSGSITIGLGTSGVTANSYGSASSVATFTVNAEGQLTAAGSTPIAINGNQITSGNVGVAYGGTGITSYTTGSLLYASGSTTLSQLNDVATGQCLISGGVSTAPSWGACSTGGGITGSGTSGDLPLFNGSNSLTNSALSQASGNLTDSGSLTIQGAGGLLLSNGTSTDSILPGSNLSALSLTLPSAAGTSGQCLSTNGAAGVLSFSDCLTGATGGSGGVVSLNTISGSVALEDTNSQLTFTVAGQNLNIHLPQNLSSTSTPSFAGLTLTSALTVGNGGTGSTTAAGARTNLGAAASGANSDITSLTGLTTALPISEGGTGQATAPTAGEVLIGTTAGGLTPAALTQGTSVSITSGSGSITIGLGTSGVTANSYGSASSVATFTVNAEGQLTAAGSTPIAINGNQITSGNVGVAYGGTGITSYTTGSLLYASGSTTLSQLNDVATGQCLISGGVSTAPSWGACSTGGGITGSGTSGDLPLFNGSNSLTNSALSQASGNLTDSGSLTIQGAGGLLLSNGTSTDSILPGSNLSALSLTLPSAAGTSGQCLSTNGAAGVLSFSDCLTGATGGSGGVVSLNTISGSVALEDTNSQLTFTVAGQNLNIHLPQNLSSTSTPSFAGLTLTSALTVGNGGTGSTTAAGARTNLGAAASGANSDITSLTGLTTALPISEGGTGQATAPTAGEVLIGTTAGGLTPAALTQGTSVSITSGSGSITIGLGTSGVTANSYGSASSVATFTVNAEGQLTAAGSTPIAINGNQITSGNVGVAYGGTGITSYTTGSLLYASGSTTLSQLNDVATGQCLISGGVSTAPSWGSCPGSSGSTLFTLQATSGSPQTVTSGSTVTIAAGSNISTTAGSTNTVTVAVVASPSFTGLTVTSGASISGGLNNNSGGVTNTGAISGATTIVQTYSSATSGTSVHTINATNSNATSTATTVNGSTISLAGATNTNGNANTINGLNFSNISTLANNNFNGLYFGTGYNSLLNYNGSSLINGTGIIQNTAFSSSVAYTGITQIGTVTAGTWNASTIGIAYGGTNTTATPTAGAVAYGTGTAYAFTAAGSSGNCLLSAGSGAPTWGNCPGSSGSTLFTLQGDSGTSQSVTTGSTVDIAGGANITTTAGATNKITVAVVASPSFTSVTATGGATIYGAATSINNSSNFGTSINTGTSTGSVSIGNSLAGAISLQSGSTISLAPSGASNTGVTIQPATNSTSALNVENNSNVSVLNVDTANGRVGVNNSSPAYALDVNGQINSNTAVSVGGVDVCTVSDCVPAAGSNNYIQNGTTVQAAANFSIRSTSTSAVTATLQGAAGQTSDILDLDSWNGTSATIIDSFNSNGAFASKNLSNSTTDFQIQNSTSGEILQVNSTSQSDIYSGTDTGSIGINGASVTAGYALNITGSLNATQIYQGGTGICLVTGNCTAIGTAGGDLTGSYPNPTVAKLQGSTLTISSPANGQLLAYNGSAWVNTNTVGNLTSKAVANSTSTFQIQNSSSAALLTGDTTNMRLGVDVTYATMATPTGVSVGTATSGGSLTASATYRYKVTAIDSAGGETAASTEATGTTGTTTLTLPVTWTAVTGASGYRVYRTAANGASGSEVYLTTVLTNSFTDTGSITAGTATPPATTTAYVSTNVSSNDLQLSVGGEGTPTGQVYVGGTAPTLTGSLSFSSTGIGDIKVVGNYAYVVGGNIPAYFNIVDVSNPSDPVILSSVSVASGPHVSVQGRYAYVAYSNGNALQIFDISNPTSPVSVSNTSTGVNASNIYVHGSYAYITDNNNNRLLIYNISNPTSPVLAGTASDNTGGGMSTLQVQGQYAYVTNATNNKFEIINVSNPNSPYMMSSTTAADSVGLFVQGRYAYVTNSGGGTCGSSCLQIFDISNPSSPSLLSTIGAGAIAKNIFVSGRYAYISTNNSNAFLVDDISNPYSPFQVSLPNTSSTPTFLYVQGRYLYISIGNSFQIFDLGGEYSQSLQAGSTETSTLQVDTNASIAGDASIQGAVNIGAGLQVAGQVGVNGSLNLSPGASLNAPTAPTDSTATTGGTLAAGNYYYKLAAISGSSITSAVSATPNYPQVTTGTTSVNTLTWSAVSGATGYIVYRSTDGANWYSNNVPSTTTSITDNGSNYSWSTTASPLGNTNNGGNLIVGGLIQGVSGTGSNVAGSNLTIAGGAGTGTGVGGNIVFQYTPAGSSGTGTNALQTACTIYATNGNLSCPAVGQVQSEQFGYGASASQESVAVGYSSSTTSEWSVAIGDTATAGFSSTVIGYNASGNVSAAAIVGFGANGTAGASILGYGASVNGGDIAIGDGASSTNTYGVAIGAKSSAAGFDGVALGDNSTASNHGSIAIGTYASAAGYQSIAINATTTADYQLVIGGGVQNAYIGNGVTNSSPGSLTLQGTGSSTAGTAGAAVTLQGGAGTTTGAGSTGGVLTLAGGIAGGSNISGSNLVLQGGQGTGTGNGGNINFQIATPSGSSGSSNNSETTVESLSGTNGAAKFENSANSTTAFQVQNASGADLLQVDTTNSNITLGGNNSGALEAWSTASNSLPSAVDYAASVTANGYVYEIGGSNGTTAQSTVYYAQLNANGSVGTWNTANALPAARYSPVAVTANGYVYVIGGSTSGSGANGTLVATVYYAKLNANGSVGTWNTASNSLPGNREDVSAAVANGYVYVLGGLGGGAPTTTVYYAQLNANGSVGTWNTANALPQYMQGASTVVANGYIYDMGMAQGQNVFAVFYAPLNSNGSIGSWTTTSSGSPTGALSGQTSVVANGYVYLIGGNNTYAGSTVQSTLYYAPLNANGSIGSWSTNGNSLPQPLGYHTSVIANGYVYALGGTNNSSLQSAVYYASTARTEIGGSLDLVGLANGTNNNSGDSGQGSVGGSLTAGDGNFIGNLQVEGQATIVQGASINGAFVANNTAIFQDASNSTTAFQVQNASGTNVLNVDTTNSITTLQGNNSTATLGSNLITNTNFTTSAWTTTGWTATSSTVTHNTGNTSALSTNQFTVIPGDTYQITFTYSGAPANGVDYMDVNLGGESDYADYYGASGTETDVISAYNTNTLAFNPSSGWTGEITSVTVQVLTSANPVLQISNSDGSTGVQVFAGGDLAENTSVGLSAGQNLTSSGQNNTALGAYSLQNTTSGGANVSLGAESMEFNTTGSNNTSEGYEALDSNTTGLENTGIGSAAIFDNTTGSYNVGIGASALETIGSGSNNIGIGYNAGSTSSYTYQNINGSNNIFIGDSSGPNTASQLQNSTAIGTYSVVDQSNSLILGCLNGTDGCTASTEVGIGTATPNAYLNVVGTTATSGNALSALTVTGGAGASTATAGNGSGITLQSGNGGSGSTANGNGGNIVLSAGAAGSGAGTAGSAGSVIVKNQSNSTTAFQVQNAAGATVLATDTTANTVDLTGDLNLNTVTAPAAPTVAVNATAGNLNGTYYYVVTYATAAGQTNYGAVSAAVSPVSQQVNLTNLPIGPSNVVTARDIYRTVAGSGSAGPFYLVNTINNDTATTYTDNVPDGSLGTAASDQNNSGGAIELNGTTILSVSNNTYYNVGIGGNTFTGVTTGNYNIALGMSSLWQDTTGSDNVAVGYIAGEQITTGGSNVAVGVQALQTNVTGSNNVAIGQNALQLATSSDNTAINHALSSVNTGSNDIGIGYGANVLYGGVSNSTVIGTGQAVGSSNTTVIGGSHIVLGGSDFSSGNALLQVGDILSTAGTITQSGTTTITGSGTSFSQGMVGSTIYYSDGTSNTITGYTSATQLTTSSIATESGQYYITWGGFNVNNGGTTLLQSTTNSVNAFNVQNSIGTSVFNVDTADSRVGISNNTPGNLLSIGALNVAAGTYQVAVSTGGTTNSGIVVQDVTSQSSGYAFQAQSSTGAALASIDYLGNLSVKAATISGTLTVDGHIVSGNISGSTTATVQSAAGSTGTCAINPTNFGSGNDTAGTIIVTPGGTGITSGIQCTINFGSAYISYPHVIISAADSASAALSPYASATSDSTFNLGINGAGSSGTTYTYNYFVVQ